MVVGDDTPKHPHAAESAVIWHPDFDRRVAHRGGRPNGRLGRALGPGYYGYALRRRALYLDFGATDVSGNGRYANLSVVARDFRTPGGGPLCLGRTGARRGSGASPVGSALTGHDE